VACNFVKGDGRAGVDPIRRYTYLRDNPTDTRLDKLDQLYTAILQNLYGSSNGDNIQLFRKVLGRILSAKEPLSLDSLTEFRSDGEEAYETRLLLQSLGSVLKGVNNPALSIQPLHASFIEFLEDPGRSSSFYVKVGSGDEVLATSSLRIMEGNLKFNICHLESSYVRNRDIMDLQTRVEKNIPEYLSYACRHFADHLNGVEHSSDVKALIEHFLYEKLLFWLEALSLLGDTYPARTQMLALKAWTEVWDSY
jgi:hypothetical protein